MSGKGTDAVDHASHGSGKRDAERVGSDDARVERDGKEPIVRGGDPAGSKRGDSRKPPARGGRNA